jgi:hypothetical protein
MSFIIRKWLNKYYLTELKDFILLLLILLDMNTDGQQLDLISDLITRNIDKLDIFQLKQVFFSLTFLYAQYTRFSNFASLLDLRLSQLVQDISISKVIPFQLLLSYDFILD